MTHCYIAISSELKQSLLEGRREEAHQTYRAQEAQDIYQVKETKKVTQFKVPVSELI